MCGVREGSSLGSPLAPGRGNNILSAGTHVGLPVSDVARPGDVTPIFALLDICFDYPLTRAESLPVIDRASLELRRGEVVSILGPSGCGKSTLLAIAAGLVRARAGSVWLDGKDATGVAGKTGFMMQRDELLAWRTVLGNVLLGPEVVNGRVSGSDRVRARSLLRIAGLTGFENHYPAALSGGMRQRAAFVRTLMLERPLVLLDEPFGALDAITRADMQEWLLRMRHELQLTLLLVTHDVDEAIFLSDRVLVMSSRPGRFILEARVPFPRPRHYEQIVAQAAFGVLKSELLHAIRAPTAATLETVP